MAATVQYGADEIETAIHAALRAGDVPAVDALLHRLATVDARRAETLYVLLRMAVATVQLGR